MINQREFNRKKRAAVEAERVIARYNKECGEVITRKATPEELKIKGKKELKAYYPDKVEYISNENTCVCCGVSIPEGRQICLSCERSVEN